MLPLTPPNETFESNVTFAEAVDRDNGVALTGPEQHISYTIPTINSSMGLDSMDDRSDVEERFDSPDLSDEDQDMSDGGAELLNDASLSTPPHTTLMDTESDLLDAEVLDHEHPGLLNSGFYYSEMDDATPGDDPQIMEDGIPSHYPQLLFDGEILPPSPPLSDLMLSDLVLATVDAPGLLTTDLPAAMSELSQQLQHIQDVQEQAEFTSEAQNGAPDNSISPPLLQSLLFTGAGNSSSPQSEESPQGQPQNAQFLASEGSVPSFLGVAHGQFGVVGTQPHQFQHPDFHLLPIHSPSSDTNWDEDPAGSEADQTEVEDQFNLSLGDFLHAWGRTMARDDEPRRRPRGPFLPAVSKQRDMTELDPMEECGLEGESCDIQRINWKELGITRLEARDMRRQTYKNYTNLRASYRLRRNVFVPRASERSDYFKFRRMDFNHDIHLAHFQLRNLMACSSRDHIFYAGKSQVMHSSPMEGSGLSSRYSVAMDLTKPTVVPLHGPGGGIQISTLTAAHDILVAGGFCGEYGITNLRADKDTKHTEGIITDDSNGITNHLQIHLSRGSSLPLVAFASNDKGVRILDINTNKIIAGHRYDHAINCTAISPDQRLRVLTGDTRKVMICNAETGEILQELEGHRDFGFACDWADDGITVATGNQDMQVKIWDARKWKNSQGMASPVATITAEMAGVRKLKFSPLGSGKRVLVAAEPADFVSIIDAGSFAAKQTLSFFGEVGGVDFTNNGNDLVIANCDSMRGGLMEFGRCGLAADSFYEYEDMRGWEGARNKMGKGYDWLADDEDLTRHPRSRGTTMQRMRRPAALATSMAAF